MVTGSYSRRPLRLLAFLMPYQDMPARITNGVAMITGGLAPKFRRAARIATAPTPTRHILAMSLNRVIATMDACPNVARSEYDSDARAAAPDRYVRACHYRSSSFAVSPLSSASNASAMR
jgi:hypothetical protein